MVKLSVALLAVAAAPFAAAAPLLGINSPGGLLGTGLLRCKYPQSNFTPITPATANANLLDNILGPSGCQFVSRQSNCLPFCPLFTARASDGTCRSIFVKPDCEIPAVDIKLPLFYRNANRTDCNRLVDCSGGRIIDIGLNLSSIPGICAQV